MLKDTLGLLAPKDELNQEDLNMKKATMAIAALLALILGCGDVLDVSPDEWAQNTERI